VQASLSQPPSGQYTVDPREIERRRAKDEANDDFSEGDMDESEATLPPTPQAEVDDIDDGDATQVSTPKGDVTTTTRTRIATPRSADTLPQTRRAEPDERATLANLGALELAARFEPLGKGETEDASLLQKWAQHNTNLLNAVSLEKLQQITSSLIPTVLGRGLHQLREELEDAEKMHPNRNIPERAQLRRALDRVDGLINRSGRFD
jgi:hypothetical protein